MSDRDIIDEQATHEIVGTCMYEYGTYVNRDRAIPDVRDGLKPSQRRILWTMHLMGVTPNKASVKSAKIVGAALGSWHPHGDASTYEALVHMTHLRYPLVHGDGNFGTPDVLVEKSPAAYRYTECKLTAAGAGCFDQIHVADMTPNYDDTKEEPVCLPSQVPLALVNGFAGVGVALKTRVPPHNLGEVVGAALHLLDNPEATTEDLLQFIKGPDYGTGTLLSKKADLLAMYETGKGRLEFRSSYTIEPAPRGRQKLIITGLVPEVKKNKLKDVAIDLAKKRLIETPITDESTLDKRHGKFHYKDTVTYRDPQIVRDRLLPLLDTRVDYNWVLLDRTGHPRRFSLVELLQEFLDFRREVETRVLQARLEKLTQKLGVVVARFRASTKLREVSSILHNAKTEDDARAQMMSLLKLKHDWQADAILESPMRSLMRLKSDELKEQGARLKADVNTTKTQLTDVDSVVRSSLTALLETADDRGTRLRSTAKDFGENQNYWVGVLADGKVDVSLDLPLKSRAVWSYRNFFSAQGDMCIVHDTNKASSAHLSYLDRYDPQGSVVGATANSHCLVITSDGRYVAFAIAQRRKSFVVVKDLGEAEIAAVVGFEPDSTKDRILVYDDDEKLRYYKPELFKVTRPNVKARPLPKRGWQKWGVLHATLKLHKTQIVDVDGNESGRPDYSDGANFFVAKQNLVVLKTNVRKQCDLETTMKLLGEDAVSHVVPL